MAFTADTLSGQQISVPGGKPSVVYFFTVNCRTCGPEAQALAQLQQTTPRTAVEGRELHAGSFGATLHFSTEVTLADLSAYDLPDPSPEPVAGRSSCALANPGLRDVVEQLPGTDEGLDAFRFSDDPAYEAVAKQVRGAAREDGREHPAHRVADEHQRVLVPVGRGRSWPTRVRTSPPSTSTRTRPSRTSAASSTPTSPAGWPTPSTPTASSSAATRSARSSIA